ncbi:MAG: histidine kinase [Candidatus Parabeggiatoa sp. nov. 3]|nr:MAG: histidine kinase [Gammaproteobacteria bacterium]
MKISTKLMVSTTSLLAVAIGFISITIGLIVQHRVEQEAQRIATEIAHHCASLVKAEMERPLLEVRAIANRLEAAASDDTVELTLPKINTLLKFFLEHNATFLGIGLIAEPNTFQKQAGKIINAPRQDNANPFVSYWTRDKNGKVVLKPDFYDDPDFYERYQQVRTESVLEPYLYPASKLWVTTFISPLFDNHLRGVVGIDIALENLQQRILELKPTSFKDAYLTVYSDQGMTIFSESAKQVGKNLKNISHNSALIESVLKQHAFSLARKSEKLGKTVITYGVPIKIAQSDKPWLVTINIPESELKVIKLIPVLEIASILGIGAILVTILIMLMLTKSIFNPLKQINAYLKILSQGKPSQDKFTYQGKDEIAEIITSVRQVKNSLQEMMENNIKQDWLKTGQNQLNEELSGEQPLIKLAENAINFITPYLDTQMGACYLADDNQQRLKMIASYAYTWRKELANEFELGEGLVGQAALERKMIIITQAPADYIYIQSGLGQSRPNAILVIPILYEGCLKAVIELASFHLLTEIQLQFLNEVMPNIGIAINTAQSRYQTQLLLQQSESQKKALETQATELQTKQKELKETNKALQSQSEILQHQAIELQNQQEELQQTNEELQTQSEELQAQQEELTQSNEELEKRTSDLELQKQEIRDKNQFLEKAQHALETKANELELASQYKSEFLANMSHELRTPLNSLLILAQLLGDNPENNLTEKQVEYARTMYSAGSDLLKLINEILDLSKVESGKMEVHVDLLALVELVETLEHKFQPVAEEKGIAFNISLADNLPMVIYTDAQRLIQIINNLLSNAFKFTEQGEIKLDISRPDEGFEVSNQTLKAANTVMIRVSDTGIGIPKDKQQVIFEAFQQVDGTTCRSYGGTGLGLSISRQLVRLLSGEIQLHSEEGKGSTFTLYLPESLAKSAESPPILTPEACSVKAVESNLQIAVEPTCSDDNLIDDRDNLQDDDKSILIIEDDRKFSRIIIELAREKQFKCLLAEEGQSGLQLAENYKPDAIILDIGLPKIDGWTVMERLKENPNTRHIPVHFMSASDHRQEAKKMGAIGYLLKPMGITELRYAFKKIDRFISKTLKNLLILIDQEQRHQDIQKLLDNDNVQSTIAKTQAIALEHLKTIPFDCIVLDIEVEQSSGIKVLEQLYSEEKLAQIPVIIYAERELTESEETVLHQYAENLTIKAVRSPARLLDETTLFLHQIEAQLPKEKQKMLRMVHDKKAILTGKKVLLVDDDIRNTYALMTFLDGLDMEVTVGNNGKEALALLDEHPDSDIVLMDIMMPEMDGYEAMRQIRTQARFRKLPIIALTAKAMKGDKTKCIEAGANDYLSKPVDTDKLISLMRVWLYR